MRRRNLRGPALGLWAIPLTFLGCGNEVGEQDAGVVTDTKTPPDALVCDGLAAAARTQLTSSLQGTGADDCQVDSDCTVLWTLPRCLSGCGSAVATSAAATVTAAAAGLCDPYYAAGCQDQVLLCLAMRAVCRQGTCAKGPPIPLDASPPDAPATEDGGLAEVPIGSSDG
jgi:hypothetical protein